MKLKFLLLLFISQLFISKASTQSLPLISSFGKKGKIYINNGRYNEVKDVVASPSNHSFFVLIESIKIDTSRDTDIILMKFSEKGIPDAKFGTKGQITFDFNEFSDSRPAELLLSGDHSFFIIGDGTHPKKPDERISCIGRFTQNGSIDLNYGNKGTAQIPFDKISYINCAELCKDGSVLIAGSYVQPFGNHSDVFPVMAKILPNGNPDKSFNKTGKIWIDFFNGVFSLASTKHTAGGEIYDIAIQEDGKIIISGGYIFKYSYEGFIARLSPDGRLDSSFNKKGFIRHDFTAGKTNFIKKVALYDKDQLIFGAASQTDYNSDFYFGSVNLKDFTVNFTNIDFNNQHDILEDLAVEKGEVILSGRSIKPEHVENHHFSDYSVICKFKDIKNATQAQKTIVSLSDVQNGIAALAVSGENIYAAGMSPGAKTYQRDVFISCFRWK